jgi:GDPmannose 4,6-dehydratase
MRRVLNVVGPDELYHLAGQSHVGLSFEIPESTCDMTAMGTLRLLEMVRDMRKKPRFFHAASSEIFGKPQVMPQDEETPLAPVNPYGCAKTFAAHMVRIYRKTYGHFMVNGIMFNHESPRRGENFVTRKICRAAAAIKFGQQKDLLLGDTSAKRDWGYAPDFVHGMWLSLQHETAEDYIFATGKLHSVQDVVETAFDTVGLDWRQHVRKDDRLLRPGEPDRLLGNPSKARRLLNWEPTVSFKQMIEDMTHAELTNLSGTVVSP